MKKQIANFVYKKKNWFLTESVFDNSIEIYTEDSAFSYTQAISVKNGEIDWNESKHITSLIPNNVKKYFDRSMKLLSFS